MVGPPPNYERRAVVVGRSNLVGRLQDGKSS
jgi:5,10-methylene-tetrahydrofolate dehydrogenase/methenyl tetrahydrofolate cyclohydrolase